MLRTLTTALLLLLAACLAFAEGPEDWEGVLLHDDDAHQPHEPHYVNGQHNPHHVDTEEELAHHKAEFYEMDANGDGLLDHDELMAEASMDDEVTDEDVEAFIDELDSNNDRMVSWDEYYAVLLSTIDEDEPEDRDPAHASRFDD